MIEEIEHRGFEAAEAEVIVRAVDVRFREFYRLPKIPVILPCRDTLPNHSPAAVTGRFFFLACRSLIPTRSLLTDQLSEEHSASTRKSFLPEEPAPPIQPLPADTQEAVRHESEAEAARKALPGATVPKP